MSTQYYDRFRKYSKLSGLTLTKNLDVREKIASFTFLLGIYVYSVLYFNRKWTSTIEIDDYLYASALANAVPRCTIMRIYRSKLADLLVMLENSEILKGNSATSLCLEIKGVVSKMGLISIPYTFLIVSITIFSWFMLRTHETLPFGAVPTLVNNFGVPAGFIMQTVVCSIMGHEYIILDTMKFSILMQLRLHFKYLKLRVHKLVLNASEDFCLDHNLNSCSAHDVSWPYLQKELKEIILHYNYLVKVAKVAEDVFNKCVLVSFINLSLLTCLILLRISNIPILSFECLKLYIYIPGVCSLFFADCYFTQKVVTENEAFAYSFYEIDFIGTNLTFQKSLILCMARAQRSVQFTIGKFAPITIYVIVLKASYSYYTLLQSRQNH